MKVNKIKLKLIRGFNVTIKKYLSVNLAKHECIFPACASVSLHAASVILHESQLGMWLYVLLTNMH